MGFLELRCLNGVSEEVRRGAQGTSDTKCVGVFLVPANSPALYLPQLGVPQVNSVLTPTVLG